MLLVVMALVVEQVLIPLAIERDAGAINVCTFLEIVGTFSVVVVVVEAISGRIFKGVMIEGFALRAALLIGTEDMVGFRLTFPLVTNEDIGTANMDVPSGEVTNAM